jgi:hypothetical protein
LVGGFHDGLLNFQPLFQQPSRHSKGNICGTCAFITSHLKKLCFGIGGGIGTIEVEAIMGWAKSCNGGETTYDIVVIPYHGEAHWSLLVVEPSHTFHFDSKIGVHDYLIHDIFIW